MQPMLRIALVLDAPVVPSWIYRAIQDIHASSTACIVAVAFCKFPEPTPAPIHRRLLNSPLLYSLYTMADAHIFRMQPDAFAPRSIYDLVPGCDHFCLQLSSSNGPLMLTEQDIARFRALDLDVVLSFDYRPFRNLKTRLARYGAWFYHHGESLSSLGGPSGFWEVMEQHPITGSILWMIDEDSASPKVIYRSYATSDKRSVRRSKNNYYWKSAYFAARKLRDLYETNGAAALDDDGFDALRPHVERYSRPPHNVEMARLLTEMSIRYLAGKTSELFNESQWFIAISGRRRIEADTPDETAFSYLLPPRDRYWADPFPVTKAGRRFIFFEELTLATDKGHISVVEINGQNICGQPTTVLERDYHLSYPFVFEWNGSYYMVPETGENRTVEIYRAVDFPYTWKPHEVLLTNINAVDPTLVEIDGTWWMFVNVAVDGAANVDELHLYYADCPFGPWHPHRGNPVKSDVRSSRPAGRVIEMNGVYYRPAQDCAERYGHAISINQIVQMDREAYVEKEVGRIQTGRPEAILGTHTLNLCGDLVCLDGEAKRSRFRRGSDVLSKGRAIAIPDRSCTDSDGGIGRRTESVLGERTYAGPAFQASGRGADLLAAAYHYQRRGVLR